MGKRKRQKEAQRRGQQKQRRQAKARADLLFDPRTAPDQVAAILRETFGAAPVELAVVPTFYSQGGIERAQAIADAALGSRRDPMALSLAADVALLDRRPADAEAHVVEALGLAADPELVLRLAFARANQGQMAAAVESLDAELQDNPGQEPLQLARGRLLEAIQDLDSPPPPEQRALDRFLDRSPFDELAGAVAQYVGPEALAGGLEEWVEAGAFTEDELTELTDRAAAEPAAPEAGKLRLISEWAWLMPVDDLSAVPLISFVDDQSLPEDLRRRAGDWVGWAMWGLWEVGQPDRTPGVVMTDLITGVRLYVEVPRVVLEGLPRWSVLLGYVLPVDGVWRAGPWFEVASPIEARELMHELVDAVMANADGFGKEGKPMVTWARRVHDQTGELWMPGAVEPPSAEAMAGLQLATRMFVPNLVATLREMQGRPVPVPETGAVHWYTLTTDDVDAAWTALADRPDFEQGDDELYWMGPEDEEPDLDDEGEAIARATLERDEDGTVGVEIEAEYLPRLLELLSALGHPTTAEQDPEVEDEPPEPPVELPDLPASELPGWLTAWADEPLEILDDSSPRQAVERDGAAAEVEMLIRYLEHQADVRGLPDLDMAALRAELGIAEGPETQ